MKKPTIIDYSRWQKEYLTIQNPKLSWDEYYRKKRSEFYREQYRKGD